MGRSAAKNKLGEAVDAEGSKEQKELKDEEKLDNKFEDGCEEFGKHQLCYF